jgi:hypothetical protein
MKQKVFITGLLWVICIYAKAQIITTIAGIAGSYGYNGDGIPATSAKLSAPSGIAIDISGNIYVAEQDNNRVRKISTSGIISTFADTSLTSENVKDFTKDLIGNIKLNDGVPILKSNQSIIKLR